MKAFPPISPFPVYCCARVLESYEFSAKSQRLIQLLSQFDEFSFVLGLGNPTSGKVLREATAALQSIFPPMSLLKFMQQAKSLYISRAVSHFYGTEFEIWPSWQY